MTTPSRFGAVPLKATLVFVVLGGSIGLQATTFTFSDLIVMTEQTYHFKPQAINDQGVVVGVRNLYWSQGFYRFPEGGLTDQSTPASYGSGLFGINNSGTAVGFKYEASCSGKGCQVAPQYPVGIVENRSQPIATTSPLYGINDSNHVVGTVGGTGFFSNSFTSVPVVVDGSPTVARALNNFDDIVGYFDPIGVQQQKGFARSPSGDFTTFHAAPDSTATVPNGINDAGLISGWTRVGASVRGFIGTPGDLMLFDVPGAAATYATGINNRNQITGWFQKADDISGATYGFILTTTPTAEAIPEPGTFALIAGGLLLLLAARKQASHPDHLLNK